MSDTPCDDPTPPEGVTITGEDTLVVGEDTLVVGEDTLVVGEDTPSTVADTEDDHPVHYEHLGEEYPIDGDTTEINIHTGRIKELTNLNRCPNLKSLIIVASLVEKIAGLEANVELEHLELYQAKVRRIENIAHLTKLKTLDLSFNGIRTIGSELENLKDLEVLYLPSNKIEQIEATEILHNSKLRLLELGANRLHQITGLNHLPCLEQLWLGKNKLNTMAIPALPQLRILDVRSNRLVSWDASILELDSLEELYMSHNQLPNPEEDFFKGRFPKLRVFEIGSNALTTLKSLQYLTELEELYITDNKIEEAVELEWLKPMIKLVSVYAQFNPLQRNMGPLYRNTVLKALAHCPDLEELDGNDVPKTPVQ